MLSSVFHFEFYIAVTIQQGIEVLDKRWDDYFIS